MFGRFRLNKSKIGKIGWKYRYRVSNKLKQLIKDGSGKTVKKGTVKLIPMEIIDYLDDPQIPYCDQLFQEEGKSDLNNPSEIEEETEEENHKKKVKVGWQYRYRISRMKNAKKIEKGERNKNGKANSVQDKTVVHNDEKKPKVGWIHRYRVSKMLEAKNSFDGKSVDVDKEKDGSYSPELKPKVGWEYRFRIQRKIDSEKKDKNLKTKSAKGKVDTEKNKNANEKDESITDQNLNTHKIGIYLFS